MSVEPGYEITVLTGVKVLKPVQFHVEMRMEGPWWWRQARYYVACEFSRLGPFDTKREAEGAAYHINRI